MQAPEMTDTKRITDDTFALSAWAPLSGVGVLPVNAFLINAAQPVLVDTGLGALGDAFMNRLKGQIDPESLRIDVFRASGAGGQHVNKTESAVRITHVPTGVVVACQTERSQHANRDRAMKMLAARLYELEIQKRNAERDAVEATKSDIGWGSQIRNYVLDQSRIKDLRTGVERSDTQNVLDGDLDEFIEASLKSGLQVGSKRTDAV